MAVNNAINLSDAGLASHDGAGTFTGREIEGTTGEINVSNGDGTAGNPTLSLATPVGVNKGGTGAASITGVLTGNGTSPITGSAVTEGGVLLGGASNAVTDTGVLAKGSILVGDGAGAPTEVGVGADNQVLTADSAEASGVKWAASGVTSEFVDNVFRVLDDGDNTKELAFEVSGVTTGTTRTVTVADQNIDMTPTTGSYQGSDADLTALAGLSSTGIVTRTAANTYALRTIQGTTDEINVSNGDGVSGNPVLSLATPLIVSKGGTGATSLTGVLTGNGTSAVTANAITEGGILLAGASNAVTDTGVLSKGTLLVGDGSGAPTQLAVGTDTFVLTADSAEGSGVKWAAAGGGGGGGWVLLETQTVTTGVSSVDFEGFIDSAYDNYVVLFSNAIPVTDAGGPNLEVQVGTGATPTYVTGSSYSWAIQEDTTDSQSSSYSGLPMTLAPVGSDTNEYGCWGVLWMMQPSNTSMYTQFKWEAGCKRSDNTLCATASGSGRYNATTAVTALRFGFIVSVTTNLEDGQFALYGVSNT